MQDALPTNRHHSLQTTIQIISQIYLQATCVHVHGQVTSQPPPCSAACRGSNCMGDFQLEHPPIKDGVKVRLLSVLEPMQGCEGTHPAMLPNLSISLGSTSSQQRMQTPAIVDLNSLLLVHIIAPKKFQSSMHLSITEVPN